MTEEDSEAVLIPTFCDVRLWQPNIQMPVHAAVALEDNPVLQEDLHPIL